MITQGRPPQFKRSLKTLSYYLGIMDDSHKKMIVPHLRTIFGGLTFEMPELDSITDPTPADLDKILTLLGRAVYIEELIGKVNEKISYAYGRYTCLADPVLELVEARENYQKSISLLKQMVDGILQHNRKKEAANGNTNSENPATVLDRPTA
jgi:hypothetical protein